MTINFNEIIHREQLYADLGGDIAKIEPFYVSKGDLKELAEGYKGTPMYDKIMHPDGFRFGNTTIKAK